jgi:toxin-antitoxin system PIN domain toxin
MSLRLLVIALLDVNVLVALFDPDHLHHPAAHLWFGRNRQRGWATCALTENALIRVLSNPSYRGRRTTMEDAASRLRTFCSDREHVFWSDKISVRDPGRFNWRHIQGHRQLTDVYLLALSISNEGRLATLDATIPLKGVEGASAQSLELLEA